MILYRFAHRKYAHDISGTGSKLKGGRWNSVGLPVVYSSERISLSLLEVLANANTLEELQMIQLTEIEVPDNVPSHEIRLPQLKKNGGKILNTRNGFVQKF